MSIELVLRIVGVFLNSVADLVKGLLACFGI